MSFKNVSKYKFLIISLSIIATIGTLIGCASNFLVYDYNYEWVFPEINTRLVVSLILHIVPCFALIATSIKYDNSGASVLLFLVLILTSLLLFMYTFETIMLLPSGVMNVLRYGMLELDDILWIVEIISYPILTVAYTVAAISSFKPKMYKSALIIGVIVSIFYVLEYCIYIPYYITNELMAHLVIYACSNFGMLAMAIALLLIAYNKKVNYPYKKDKQFVADEQMLLILKEDYESGKITEEAYKVQRTEIINRL